MLRIDPATVWSVFKYANHLFNEVVQNNIITCVINTSVRHDNFFTRLIDHEETWKYANAIGWR